MERVDLVVVGAGPAGATAAIAAKRFRPSWRVVVLDRSTFPRDKACGDAIAAHAFDELARVGVTGVERDAPPVWELRLRAPDGSVVRGRGRRPNRVIRRTTFDARVVDEAVRAGAELVHHRVRDVDVGSDHVVVDGRWAAPWLIAADGATSVVRRRMGVPPAADRHRAIAARAYADAEEGQTGQRIDMIAHGWPSYAWSFPLGDGRANVGYGLRVSELDGHGRRVLVDRVGLAASSAHDPDSVAIHPLPLSTGRPRPDHGRVLLTGDAAGLINPLTGEGIFYAIASGRLAAIAMTRSTGRASRVGSAAVGSAGRLYRAMLDRRFRRHFATTWVLARLLDVPAVFDVAVDAARDPAAFDDLAEIGLGEGVMTRRLALAIGRAALRQHRTWAGAGPSGG